MKIIAKSSQTHPKSCFWRLWGAVVTSWAVLALSLRHLGAVLARLGAIFDANLDPRWRPNGPSWAQDGHLDAIWRAMLLILAGLWGDLCRNRKSLKTDDSTTFLLHFWSLGGLVRDSRELCYAILVVHWVVFDALGLIL